MERVFQKKLFLVCFVQNVQNEGNLYSEEKSTRCGEIRILFLHNAEKQNMGLEEYLRKRDGPGTIKTL